MKVLVTGATGFVGRAVVPALLARGYEVRAAVRRAVNDLGLETAVVGDIGPSTDWSGVLVGVEAVVHLAARVHVMRVHSDGEREFERVNTQGTLRLAQAAALAGARRFVFVSTIKVNGEETRDTPFRVEDAPNPMDAYSRSKLAAEQGFAKIKDLEAVILRPPLIYGPGVKGNLARLCRLAELGLPVPFGSISNQRDLIGVENLADLIVRCVSHPAAAGHTFLACDGSPISTPELYRCIASALGRPARILPVPVALLRTVARPFGLEAEIARLTGSLRIDIASTCQTLGWQPPRPLREGIAEMALTHRTGLA